MNSERLTKEVIQLKEKGLTLDEIVGTLAERKYHFFQVRIMLKKQFQLTESECERMLKANPYFLKQMSKYNPFNELFEKEISSSRSNVFLPPSQFRKQMNHLLEQGIKLGLSSEDSKTVAEFVEYNEGVLALDTLITQLYEYDRKISPKFFQIAQKLIAELKMDGGFLEMLTEMLEE